MQQETVTQQRQRRTIMSIGLQIYTIIHVLLSLAGIGSGFAVFYGLLTDKRLEAWTRFFLVTTAATSVTGFFFPVHRFLPSHALGITSRSVLVVATAARYRHCLAGAWRWLYVVGAVAALYLNVLVLIVQSFAKIAALKDLPPSSPAFVQLTVLTLFIFGGVLAARRFRGLSVQPSESLPAVVQVKN
jgi:hypothetical protein